MTDQLTLEQRVDRLESVNAIKALKHEYFRACDAKDPARVGAVFTEDADVAFAGLGHWKSRQEFVDYYAGLALTKLADGRWAFNEMHLGQHGDVTMVDDDTATGRWTLHFVRADLNEQPIQADHGATGPTFTALSLEYEDTYVRRDGRWWIRSCVSRPKAMIIQPLAEGAIVNHLVEAAGV